MVSLADVAKAFGELLRSSRFGLVDCRTKQEANQIFLGEEIVNLGEIIIIFIQPLQSGPEDSPY